MLLKIKLKKAIS